MTNPMMSTPDAAVSGDAPHSGHHLHAIRPDEAVDTVDEEVDAKADPRDIAEDGALGSERAPVDPVGHAPDSVEAFEALTQSSMKARRWATGVGAITLLVGFVLTFSLSVAVNETGSSEAAKSEGASIAAAMLAITVMVALTAGRGAFDLATALGLPEKRRGSSLALASGSLVMAFVVAGLTLLTFVVGNNLIEAARVEQLEALFSEVQGSYLYRDDLPTLGYFELAVGTFMAAVSAWLMSRAGRAQVHEESMVLARRRAVAVVVGFGVLFAVAIAFPYFLAAEDLDETTSPLGLVAGAVVGGIAMLVARPRAATSEAAALLRSEAIKDDAVQDALGEIRRGTQRLWMTRVASAIVGVGVTYGGVQLADVYYADLPRYEQPGLFTFLGLVAAGVMAALLVSKRLAPKPVADDAILPTGGLFDESLETTGSLTVRQNFSLLALLFGESTGQRFELIDGGGAWCGTAKEESSILAKMFLGWRRPLTIAVDDLGECALRVSRPFALFGERAAVTAGNRRVGDIRRTWSPFRSVYVVTDADGRLAFTLKSGWVFKSRFRIEQNGESTGELRRLRKPWYVRMFRSGLIPETDRFGLTFPPSSNLDQRRLLVGALFLVDTAT